MHYFKLFICVDPFNPQSSPVRGVLLPFMIPISQMIPGPGCPGPGSQQKNGIAGFYSPQSVVLLIDSLLLLLVE